jgi:hypothetical protein
MTAHLKKLLDKVSIDKLESELNRTRRYDICHAFPKFIALTTNCTQCGCFMAFKTWIKSASCPLEKW